MKTQPILKLAAIVCRDVATGHAPILFAERSEPEDQADSGWQFLCGVKTENWEEAQVWAVYEVLDLENSLSPFIELPVGTVLTRASKDEKWHTSNKCLFPEEQ